MSRDISVTFDRGRLIVATLRIARASFTRFSLLWIFIPATLLNFLTPYGNARFPQGGGFSHFFLSLFFFCSIPPANFKSVLILFSPCFRFGTGTHFFFPFLNSARFLTNLFEPFILLNWIFFFCFGKTLIRAFWCRNLTKVWLKVINLDFCGLSLRKSVAIAFCRPWYFGFRSIFKGKNRENYKCRACLVQAFYFGKFLTGKIQKLLRKVRIIFAAVSRLVANRGRTPSPAPVLQTSNSGSCILEKTFW